MARRWSRWAPAKLARRVKARQDAFKERTARFLPAPVRGTYLSGSPPGSAQSLVDAVALNRWHSPYGGEASSFDVYAGGFSSRTRWGRAVGRAVGTVAAIWTGAAYATSGGATAAPAEVGAGLPLAPEAGAGITTGLTTPTAAGAGLSSYLPSATTTQNVGMLSLLARALTGDKQALDELTGGFGSMFVQGGEGGGGASGSGAGSPYLGAESMPGPSPIVIIVGGIALLVGGFFLLRKLRG